MGLSRLQCSIPVVGAVAILLVGGCGDGAAGPWTGQIDSVVIGVSGLPDELDSVTTFTYVFPTVNAESVLVSLLESGIPVHYAWRPLDNRCEDPIGPRFTAQLYQDDPRILDRDFVRGAVGRLLCATELMRYEVRPGG
jgi:hypothetical protein